jgi:hypothetical protein
MHRRPSYLALLLAPSLIAIAGGGCLPGSGSIKIIGDSGLGLDGPVVADGAPNPEARIVTPDGAGADTGGSGKQDGSSKLDSKPKPKPDTKPSGPQPPFGSSKGMTATNFTDVPDCKDVKHSLHPLWNKHKAVVMAMMSPS